MRTHEETTRKTFKTIISAVREKGIEWGTFVAVKGGSKTILLAGTKKKSIGRFLGKELHAHGWEVWLYSRHTRKVDHLRWHERRCDISSEEDVRNLLKEIPRLDVAVQLADVGGMGTLEALTEKRIKEFIRAKLTGSVLLTKEFIRKVVAQRATMKLIWVCGRVGRKPKDLVLYSTINSGLASLVDALNEYYHQYFTSYYLPIPLISPSSLGDRCIKLFGSDVGLISSPAVVLKDIVEILNNNIAPGVKKAGRKVL